ncbi:MAG: butyrate kinase [Petroclostridium sp.]|jgi:butyrate kinase|uniref:butyrate kinase n=1 Tax=Petroclostridium xylanilyticum TaxID=1792311 RepID=UPI000B986974|nr:butyrate kinase [Petroclostridium xylanilyticum]MBZ4644756.1 buk [Clostridia bacterium]MDK2810333.1 butyrate kinase [Petroclostridium sp.]
MQKIYKILTINPGSTSTKVAFFQGLECISSRTLQHSSGELEQYSSIMDQYFLRKQAIMEYLSEQNIDYKLLDAVVGRGGLLKPLKGGTYHVNHAMLEDLKNARYGQHASNLGAVIAYEIASLANIPCFIVNPVVVDEFEPLARYSGLPDIPRKSAFHALNQKAVAMRAAKETGKRYDEVNLIVAHLGGGISVAAHCKGKVIDVNNGLEEGPFSPERSGSLPVIQLVDMCFSGQYSKDEIKKKLVGKGGLAAYLGTSDGKEIEQRIDRGDEQARLALEAMAYQIAKEIASCSAVLYGNVDNIIITGGLARDQRLVTWITERVKFIAPVKVYPGENEMSAMAEGAYRVLTGEEKALHYE